MNKRSIFGLSKDFVLNILASLISTGVMQIIFYPQMAKVLGPESYGTMLTIMGYVSVITLAFGNNLCNARLLQQGKYNEQGRNGDFQILVTLSSILSAIAIFVVCYVQSFGGAMLLIGVSTATLLMTLRGYYFVAYRLELNYVKNLLANIVLAAAFILGAYVLLKYLDWPWIFAIASFSCLVFIFFTSKIFRESFSVTPLFKSSLKLVTVLLVSGLIANSTTYLDRFIIHPLLGGEAVSTYSTAAFFVKSITLVLSPMVSVLLNYFTMGKIKLTRKVFFILAILYFVGGLAFFGVSISLGPIITGWLYPTLIDAARELILVVSVGLVIGVIGDFTAVLVLVNSPSYWQIVLSSLKFSLYLGLGILFVNLYGIWGMCYAIIVTNVTYYFTSFGIVFFYLRKSEKANGEKERLDETACK